MLSARRELNDIKEYFDMAICYRIAEHHNANITIDTGPSGTSVFVRFKNK